MVDGSFQKTGLLHALAQLPKQPRSSLRELRALFSGNKERSLLYEQIERDRMRLEQKANGLSGQLNDLMTVELSGAEETFRILRRLTNLRPSKINEAKGLYSVCRYRFTREIFDGGPLSLGHTLLRTWSLVGWKGISNKSICSGGVNPSFDAVLAL